MMKLIILFIAAFTETCSSSYLNPSSNLSYTLDKNLILNSNITTNPPVGISGYTLYPIKYQNWETKVLYVKIVEMCQIVATNIWSICKPFIGITCGQQFISTDSSWLNEQIYQRLIISKAQQYELSFDYISSIPSKPQSTGMIIYWNGKLIQQIKDGSCVLKTAKYYLISQSGLNEIMFVGIGTADVYGLIFRNVKLQKLIYQNIGNTTQNNSNTSSNSNTSIPTDQSESNKTNSSSTNSNTSVPTNQSQQNKTNSSSTNKNEQIPPQQIYSIQYPLQQFNLTQQYKSLIRRMIKLVNHYQSAAITINIAKKSLQFTLGMMIQFRHFILYNFHKRNFTVLSNLLLAYVREQQNIKSKFIDREIYSRLDINPETITKNYDVSNNFSVGIMNLIPEIYIRPDGMLIQMIDSLVLDFPFILVLFIFSYLAFILLFNYNISILFRSYYFWGYIILLYLDGKVETTTFYFISQLMYFRSRNFGHKIQLLVMVYYYYFVFFCAIGILFVFKWFYGKLARYTFQNSKNSSLQAVVYLSINFGPINILFGAIHRLLWNYPQEQIICLMLIQLLSLLWTFYWFLKKIFESNLSVIIYMLMGASRFGIVITIFYFGVDYSIEDRLQQIQNFLFYSFFGLWILSCVLNLFQKIKLIITISIKQCKQCISNKIYNDSQQIQQSDKNKTKNNEQNLSNRKKRPNNPINLTQNKKKKKQLKIEENNIIKSQTRQIEKKKLSNNKNQISKGPLTNPQTIQKHQKIKQTNKQQQMFKKLKKVGFNLQKKEIDKDVVTNPLGKTHDNKQKSKNKLKIKSQWKTQDASNNQKDHQKNRTITPQKKQKPKNKIKIKSQWKSKDALHFNVSSPSKN